MATTSEAMQNPPVISRRSQDTWLDRLLRHPNLIRIVSVFIFFACWEYFGRNVNPLFQMFVPIVVLAAIGAVLTELVAILERRLSRWRALERGGF